MSWKRGDYTATIVWHGPFASIAQLDDALLNRPELATSADAPQEGIYLYFGARRMFGVAPPTIRYIGEGRRVGVRLATGDHPIQAESVVSGIFVGKLFNVELEAAKEVLDKKLTSIELGEKADQVSTQVQASVTLAMKRRRRLVERALVFLLQPQLNREFKDVEPQGPRTIVNRFANLQTKRALERHIGGIVCWNGIFGNNALVWISVQNSRMRIAKSNAYSISARLRRWFRRVRKRVVRPQWHAVVGAVHGTTSREIFVPLDVASGKLMAISLDYRQTS